MEIIISRQCESLTGSLGRDFGYHIQKRKNGFFAKRNTKGSVPPDGHLRFIFACAELAQNGLHISDIRLSGYELKAALTEIGFVVTALRVDVDNEYSADEVLQFKNERGL